MQPERDYALKCFKSGETPILVATDVAARGLDVKELKHVINFDFPGNVEDFVHRIGRTGRGGASGSAYTFFDPKQDKKSAKDLVGLLKDADQPIPKDLEDMAWSARGGQKSNSRWNNNRGGSYGRGGGNRWGNQGSNRQRWVDR